MKVNKEKNNFKCKWCDSTYRSKSSKSRHQRECLLAPSLRNIYHCVRCTYETTRKDSFDRQDKTCSKKRSKVCIIGQLLERSPTSETLFVTSKKIIFFLQRKHCVTPLFRPHHQKKLCNHQR